MVIEKIIATGLKLNLKNCQLGQFKVNYLGFQFSTDLGLSDGFREKVEQSSPPATENDLQKISGICNYVRDHVPSYQKYATPLYACLKKSDKAVKENQTRSGHGWLQIKVKKKH